MKPELRAKILAYNREMEARKKKASDLDVIVAAFKKLPPGQLKKVLTDEVLRVLGTYGVEI